MRFVSCRSKKKSTRGCFWMINPSRMNSSVKFHQWLDQRSILDWFHESIGVILPISIKPKLRTRVGGWKKKKSFTVVVNPIGTCVVITRGQLDFLSSFSSSSLTPVPMLMTSNFLPCSIQLLLSPSAFVTVWLLLESRAWSRVLLWCRLWSIFVGTYDDLDDGSDWPHPPDFQACLHIPLHEHTIFIDISMNEQMRGKGYQGKVRKWQEAMRLGY